MAKEGTQKNQGEGNRDADRKYREGATEFADTPEQQRAAREAEREESEKD